MNCSHGVGTDCPLLQVPASNLPMDNLTSRAHVCLFPALMATAVLPAPSSTGGRFAPISARGEIRNEREKRITSLRDAVMELGGQGPLASSPLLKVSPCPSAPAPL